MRKDSQSYAPGKLLLSSVQLIGLGYLAAVYLNSYRWFLVLVIGGFIGMGIAFKDIRRGRH